MIWRHLSIKKFFTCVIAFALSAVPGEANAANEQMYSTESVEQASVPNYIGQAEAGVKKYYPQYVEYFKPIFTRTYKLSTSSQNIINTKVQENFEYFDEELPSEKDRITTILLTLEKTISNTDQLAKSMKWTSKGNDLIAIAEEIINDAEQQAEAESAKFKAETAKAKAETAKNEAKIARIKQRNKKLDEINNYINTNEINKKTMEGIVDKIEEYLKLCEIEETREDIGVQAIIEQYINCTKQINRTPSKLWQEFINEYNKVKKQ